MTSIDHDWTGIARRNARSVQTTIGWIFWDPGAIRRYTDLGLPEQLAGPLGYMASRCAPLAGAGPDAVVAAFGSISPVAIHGVFGLLDTSERFLEVWEARDEAVVAGLRDHAPEIVAPLMEIGPELWRVVEQLPLVGRTFFGAHLRMPRPSDPLLSGWHAVNCLREWRGDTPLGHRRRPRARARRGVDPAQRVARVRPRLAAAISRGTSDADLEYGWAALDQRGPG